MTSDFLGHYTICKDNIIEQSIHSNGILYSYKHGVIERKWVILNDTTIQLISMFSHLKKNLNETDKKVLIMEPATYGFFPNKNKPDSTKT